MPKLSELITVKGCTVTIDAMGCQQDIEDEFRFGKEIQVGLSQELDHGRIGTGKCSVVPDFRFIENCDQWENLKSIVKIESSWGFENSDKPMETAVRYYTIYHI